MSNAKPPKPESLEAKFKLMTLLPYDRRAKRKHCLVFGFILDWYHSRYGDALASVRHIVATIKERDPAGIGLYTGDVHSALSDLVSWGYLTQQKGSGRRASRYVPVWSKIDSVQKTPNTTEDEFSVRENQNASVRETPNANGDSVRDSMNEDPSTPIRVLDPETGKDGHDCAAPVAPPLAPLERATAETAQGGFEELWRAYGHRQKKKEAKAAYEKLSPGAELHDALVASARAWQASWAAQGNVDAPRFTLAKWIEREEYECDPPTAYKSKARTVDSAPKKFAKPRGARVVDIVGSDIDGGGGRTILKLLFSERDRPETWWHSITIEHPIMDVQAEGQKEFAALCRSLDLLNVSDSSELECRAVLIEPNSKGKLDYHPAPANDNTREAA